MHPLEIQQNTPENNHFDFLQTLEHWLYWTLNPKTSLIVLCYVINLLIWDTLTLFAHTTQISPTESKFLSRFRRDLTKNDIRPKWLLELCLYWTGMSISATQNTSTSLMPQIQVKPNTPLYELFQNNTTINTLNCLSSISNNL